VYSIRNTLFDVGMMMLFGVLGYLMDKFDYEPAPLVLAFVLGPILEQGLRQSLRLSGVSFLIFFNRPLSAILLGVACLLTISYFFFKKQREVLDVKDEKA
jgi:putative tricarboxylic transport membrane protein